jgi:hypothetical protein
MASFACQRDLPQSPRPHYWEALNYRAKDLRYQPWS